MTIEQRLRDGNGADSCLKRLQDLTRPQYMDRTYNDTNTYAALCLLAGEIDRLNALLEAAKEPRP